METSEGKKDFSWWSHPPGQQTDKTDVSIELYTGLSSAEMCCRSILNTVNSCCIDLLFIVANKASLMREH